MPCVCVPSPCDRPRAVESLRGKEVMDVAAGGAHSACITSAGELFTWGKGRYGRLGHGDSEDQTRPKQVSGVKCTALHYLRQTAPLIWPKDPFHWPQAFGQSLMLSPVVYYCIAYMGDSDNQS